MKILTVAFMLNITISRKANELLDVSYCAKCERPL